LVAEHGGPCGERTLGEDCVALGQLLTDHASLSRAQLTALLYADVEGAMSEADRELERLSAPASLLHALLPLRPAVELLRCAALLEAPVLTSLPPLAFDEVALTAALERVHGASPKLDSHVFVPVRALRLRGRLFEKEIWHGVPSTALELDATHVAWQAAHEATVAEVAEAARAAALQERGIEHVALVLLAERATAAGLEREHRAWVQHFAMLPSLLRESLNVAQLQTLASLTE
jgi:hypothetical protein